MNVKVLNVHTCCFNKPFFGLRHNGMYLISKTRVAWGINGHGGKTGQHPTNFLKTVFNDMLEIIAFLKIRLKLKVLFCITKKLYESKFYLFFKMIS